MSETLIHELSHFYGVTNHHTDDTECIMNVKDKVDINDNLWCISCITKINSNSKKWWN